MDNVITTYTVIINDPLTEIEVATLKDSEKIFSIQNVEYGNSVVSLTTQMNSAETFKAIANWMDSVGAAENIFCIQQVTNFYTGYTSPEVKDLLRV